MNKTNDLQINDQEWWDEYCYGNELKEAWEFSKPKYSKKELLEIFPEAKEIIPLKIADRCLQIAELRSEIKIAISELMDRQLPEVENYFIREWIKRTLVLKLLEDEKHLIRLRDYMDIILNKKMPYKLTEEQIDRARQVPIHEIAERYIMLRRVGSRYQALCPFHDEKTPSFIIFPGNNFYCFGCMERGDTIRFVELIESMKFYEAVKFLLNN